MIDPKIIQTGNERTKKGLYESYYFRGNSDTGQSFWLKHNLMLFKKDNKVRFESTVIVFDRDKDLAKSYKHEEFLPIDEYEKLKSAISSNWENFEYKFNNGYMKITPNKLIGSFEKDGQTYLSWDLDTNYSNETYYHFSEEKFYHIGFPKKKILTKDIAVKFSGKFSTPELNMEGDFVGMNGHNWGTEHAYKYIYANCNQFDGVSDAYFDGFTAQIALAGGIIKSPPLSACSLKFNGTWYHFNDVLGSWKHKLETLTMKSWFATFGNKDFLLEVEMEGHSVPWITLKYDHPSRKVSEVHNTKFANGTLTLIEKNGMKEIAKLKSSWFELESLIP